MIAAKAACDKLLKAYAKRPVFILFASFALVELAVEFLIVANPQAPITVSAQAITTTVAAYFVFWIRSEISTA